MYMHITAIIKCIFYMWLIKDIPQQHNGIDCGLFVCQYALHHISNKPMTFKQVANADRCMQNHSMVRDYDVYLLCE